MSTEIVVWYSVLFLQLLVCAVAFWRRLQRRLPIFTIYLVILAGREVFLLWTYYRAGYNSRLYFKGFWITQTVLSVTRAAAIGELVWNAARPYIGFRFILKCVLIGVVGILLLLAAFQTAAKSYGAPALILGSERSFELMAALVLVVMLGLGSRYQVPWQATQRLIAFGLLAYSIVQILNNSISRQWLGSYFHPWAILRTASFYLSLVVWLIAI